MKKPFFALWILTLALFIFSWIYLPGISKYRDLKIKQDQLEEDFLVMEEKVKAIREERDLLKNDVQYLEKVIRDELGLVKPGEVVYKFVPEPPKKEVSPSPAPSPVQPANTEAEVKPKAPPMATSGNPLKNMPSVMNSAARAVQSGNEPKTVPEIRPDEENQAAEGQVIPFAGSPGAVDINVSEPTETDEPVYPRQEIR